MNTQLFSSFPGSQRKWMMDIRGKLFSTKTVNSYLNFNKEPMRCIFILKMWISFIIFRPPEILLLMNRSNL